IRAEAEVALSKARTNDELRESIHSLLEEVERLGRTADQLLLLARADAGALQARGEPVDLADLVEETVDRWRTLASPRGVEISFEAPESGVATGDADLLRRLLDNLIDNAIRHSPAGGVVDVSLTQSAVAWLLTVADSGPGVDPALRGSIFERFTRGDAARQRETGGAGLGLALCAAIAQSHGGSIQVGASNNGGAMFTVELPRDGTPSSTPSAEAASTDFSSTSGESEKLLTKGQAKKSWRKISRRSQ
ncbi:MAG: ATP-binding protein, partial [Candidatus Dormibacteraeota bacterium]|nr:ATP-binding protein [Candidatus Dormibacteraeota bacterium]